MVKLEEELDYDGNIPESFRAVQQSLNDFVEINYETAVGLLIPTQVTETDLIHYRGRILDIIRNNPPLSSIPKYLNDGREDYFWYSDFYSDISKAIYHQYRTFVKPVDKITPVNYTEELAKIDLPYFKEVVDLVSLEKLCVKYEQKELFKEKAKTKATKRSYQAKLSKEQYRLLTDCIETIKLFRSKIKVSELRKLLSGKLIEPLQVTNQKVLVYLLDQLSEYKYIKKEWIAVADGNKDFISFRTEGNKERYGNEIHYINMTQLNNCRNRNKKERITGLENIEDLIEELREDSAE